MKIDVFDFFSGCGGTSSGFQELGLNIKLAIDIDADAIKTFKANFPEAITIQSDIRNIKPNDLEEIIQPRENPILFCGCAPCQPFSKQNRQRSINDSRINLLDEFAKFVEAWLPEYIFVENVPGMQKKAAKSETFQKFLELLTKLNYQFDTKVVEAQWFGVPQKRTRLVLIASRIHKVSIPAPTHGFGLKPFSTLSDWISDLPEISHGETCFSDPDHFSLKLSPMNLERIKNTPEGGGRESWPEHLILECHKGYKGHSDVYGRLSWNKPAVGLTTRCISYSNGRFGHPSQDRALSLREAACLQTFPKNFRFFGNKSSRARQVGNAVPPLMASSIARGLFKETHAKEDKISL